MVLKFSKKNTNYSQQNIVDVLMQASQIDYKIYNFMNSQSYILKVEGDIHRSQWTADNTMNNYWLKIKVYDSDMNPVPGYTAIHIYVCFQTITYNYQMNQYIFENCINPNPKKSTDIADVNGLNGFWSFVNISYGINPNQYFFDTNNVTKKTTPKKINKKLDIINPKTGKKIKII